MADNIVTLRFDNDLYTDARREQGHYTGSVDVDYTTGTYSGRVNTSGAGFSASVGLSGNLSASGNSYAIRQSNFIVNWTSQQPTTADVEFVLNTSQDFRTSLNPAGQRNQPVTSSPSGAITGGSTGGGTTGGSTGGGTTGGGSGSSGKDVTATLTFNNDLYTDARGERATYSGSVTVDYTTGTYSGRVNTKGAGFSASVGLSGHLSGNGSSYAIRQSNFIVTWTGQQPTTAGVEFVLNTSQDFRTSLNPPGQRNQPVTSSGSGTTNAARAYAGSVALPTVGEGSTERSSATDASTAFVFDPGNGHDVVSQFRALGAGHDTLSLSSVDLGNSVAEVLRDTRNVAGGAVITDPVTHDTVRLLGVTKGQLAHDRGDLAFHG